MWHILAVGLPSDFAAPAEGETGPELARRARAAGAFIGLAHPQWYGLSTEDGLALEAAHAVEIYNHTCELLSARPDGTAMLDQLLQAGRWLGAYAADDAHFKAKDSLGGWVMVKAERNDPALLLEALKEGRYYSSQGPEILDAKIERDHLFVATSPVRSIVLSGHGASSAAEHGENLTQACMPLRAFENSWFRLTITDHAGKRAWSQPAKV